MSNSKCARTACNNNHQNFQHTQSKQFYCASCARKINESNPGLVVAQKGAYWRTLIRIVETASNYIKVVIPAWNPHEEVEILRAKFPFQEMQVGERCYAEVNIGVETKDQLRFEGWERSCTKCGVCHLQNPPGKLQCVSCGNIIRS